MVVILFVRLWSNVIPRDLSEIKSVCHIVYHTETHRKPNLLLCACLNTSVCVNTITNINLAEELKHCLLKAYFYKWKWTGTFFQSKRLPVFLFIVGKVWISETRQSWIVQHLGRVILVGLLSWVVRRHFHGLSSLGLSRACFHAVMFVHLFSSK